MADSPLTAPPRNMPVGVRRRRRVYDVAASIGLVALAVVTAIVGVAAFTATRSVPEATIEPPAPAPAEPAAEEEGGEAEALETGLAGGPAWLSMPAGDPAGIALLLPDAGDDPRALLDTAAAATLRAHGWATAAAALGGESWGSPASTDDLVALHAWASAVVGPAPVLLAASGMGATTGLAALTRAPDLEVACAYLVSPLADLAVLAEAEPELAARIVSAWGRAPAPEENPILHATSLPSSVSYRIIVPSAPPFRADQAEALVAALEESARTVSSSTSSGAETSAALGADLVAFARGCSA